MKKRSFLIIILAVLLAVAAAGCRGEAPKEPVQSPVSVGQETEPELKEDIVSREEAISYGEVTDPEELEQFWQEYFYDTIATIGNTRHFDSAAEIDPRQVAEFGWNKYVADYGMDDLERASEESGRRLFPLDLVLDYARHYFNLSSLEVTGIKEEYYDQKRSAFIFGGGGKEDRPSYTEPNPWGTHLDKVIRNEDGTVTAVLVRYDSYQGRRLVELKKTYTLKQREDGSLYFVNGYWEWVNNHLVSLNGDYRRFDKIEGFEGNMEELAMLGEHNNSIIFAHAPWNEGESASLMLVNAEHMRVEKKLDFPFHFGATDVALKGDKIVIRLQDRVVFVDKDLAGTEEISLPAAITQKIERRHENGNYFGGYDITADVTGVVYADKTGVTLYSLTDGSEQLLMQSVPISGSHLTSQYYHSSPRYVYGDQKVISTLLGYESIAGFSLYSFLDGTAQTFDSAEGSSSGFIRYDTGLLHLKSDYVDKKNTLQTLLYLDFAGGEMRGIELGDAGDGGYIRSHNEQYVGENFAAFITHRLDTASHYNHMNYLHRLNLETFEVETEIASVKAASMHILGVLADGRVVFWYNLNPSENGLCITAPVR